MKAQAAEVAKHTDASGIDCPNGHVMRLPYARRWDLGDSFKQQANKVVGNGHYKPLFRRA